MAGEHSATNVTPVPHPTPTRLRRQLQRANRLESRLWRVTVKVFSRHDRNIAPMSLQQLWMPAHNLNQFKPVSIPTWMGRAHEDQLLAEELSMAAMEEMSPFSSGCGPWQAAIAPVDTCTGGQPLWDSVGYQKQNNKKKKTTF